MGSNRTNKMETKFWWLYQQFFTTTYPPLKSDYAFEFTHKPKRMVHKANSSLLIDHTTTGFQLCTLLYQNVAWAN